jgi:uncharacterized protein (DUF952 family)
MIYHITSKYAWEKALSLGYYSAESLEIEGFIHCSKKEQVNGVLERYYQGARDLVILTIDPGKLEHSLRYELAPSVQEEFPHIYGTINLDAVVQVETIN